MFTQESLEWKDYLVHILLSKPAEVVQKATEVLEVHGCPVKKELKCELYITTVDPKHTLTIILSSKCYNT